MIKQIRFSLAFGKKIHLAADTGLRVTVVDVVSGASIGLRKIPFNPSKKWIKCEIL